MNINNQRNFNQKNRKFGGFNYEKQQTGFG